SASSPAASAWRSLCARSPTCPKVNACQPARNAASPPSSARRAATSAPPAAIRNAAEAFAPGPWLRVNRPCSRCGTPIGRLEETCPSCGAYNKAEPPLYVFALGALIVLLLFLLFGDFGAVVRTVSDYLAQFRRG